MNPAIDSHHFIKNMVQAGATEKQAELTVDFCSSLVQDRERVYKANLATKADLEVGLKTTEINMIKWFSGILIAGLIAQGGVIVALIKLL